MKTKSSKSKSAPELRVQSSNHHSAPEQTPKPAAQTPAEPRELLHIDREQRQANRLLPTEQVLDLLQRRLVRAYELAEVVGKWVWVTFPERQPQQITAELSQLGFHWNNRRQTWQHPCGAFKGEATDPRTKYQSFHPADAQAA